MNTSILLCVPLAQIVLLPFPFIAFFTFDRLMQHFYAAYRSEWKRLGQPHGFLWRPPEPNIGSGLPMFRSSMAWLRTVFSWLFIPPPSLQNDNQAAPLLRRLRLSVLIWNAGMLVVLLVVLLIATLLHA